MKLFGISFIHCAILCDDGSELDHAMETIYLVSCPTGNDVRVLAAAIGKSIEHEYENMDGLLLRWVCAGFRCCELLDEQERNIDKLEVFSRFMKLATARLLLADYERSP